MGYLSLQVAPPMTMIDNYLTQTMIYCQKACIASRIAIVASGKYAG